MSELYKCIMACTQDNNKAHKLSAIKQHSYWPGVKELFRLMLCPSVKYYTTKKPADKPGTHPVLIITDSAFFVNLQYILDRNLRGKALDEALTDLYWNCSLELGEVLKWCIARKNPAEIGKALVNKVHPGLIRTQDYMGAVPGTEEALDRLPWTTGVMVQKKEDGMAVLVQYKDGFPISLTSRQGEDITRYFPRFLSRLAPTWDSFNSIVHHEVFVQGYPRPKANGLINGQVKRGVVGGELDDNLHSVLLDVYEAKSCLSRFTHLRKFKTFYSKRVWCEYIHTKAHAKEIAQEYISDGFEGVVCKSPRELFKNGKPWFNVKIKNEFTIELTCIDTKPHKTKAGMIGSVLMVSSDLKLQVWVTPKCHADKLLDEYVWLSEVFSVTIEATTAMKKGKCSADLPRFAGDTFDDYHRADKFNADDYPMILAQEAASRACVQLETA